jgi:hypothetical protein
MQILLIKKFCLVGSIIKGLDSKQQKQPLFVEFRMVTIGANVARPTGSFLVLKEQMGFFWVISP